MQNITFPVTDTATDLATEANGLEIPTVDPRKVLESVVSELELLSQETAAGAKSELINLHAALLVYELGGRAELIPSVNIGFGARRIFEFRVAKAARRIAGSGRDALSSDVVIARACSVIEDLIHLIDPELRQVAA